MASTADVVVVGAGVVGASAAFHLASMGVRNVVVCERRWPAAGATGKSGALVRTHYTNEPEARLAQASLSYFHRWAEMVGRGDCGFLKCGMVRLVAREVEPRLRANVDMLERIGVNTRIVGREELADLVPGWHLEDVVVAAWEPDSGCADPVGTTHGFLERARDLGATVQVQTEVTGIDVVGGRVREVHTSAGSIATEAAVVAGGAWSVPLLRMLGIDVRSNQSESRWRSSAVHRRLHVRIRCASMASMICGCDLKGLAGGAHSSVCRVVIDRSRIPMCWMKALTATTSCARATSSRSAFHISQKLRCGVVGPAPSR